MVASLARPGGSVTGLSSQQADAAGKRLELLREVLPRLRRLAIIGNVGFPQGVLEMGEVQALAPALGIEVAPLEIRRAERYCTYVRGAQGRARGARAAGWQAADDWVCRLERVGLGCLDGSFCGATVSRIASAQT